MVVERLRAEESSRSARKRRCIEVRTPVPSPRARPNLLRAVFANLTGQLLVYQSPDSALIVDHRFLGSHSIPSFTPLLINLEIPPKRLVPHVG